MRAVAIIRALGPMDARAVSRDSMLRWTLVLSPLFALAFRYLVPLVTRMLETHWDFDLVPYYPLVVSFIALIAPALVGTVIGFLMLDQRDDDSLTALLVTPLSLGEYLAYRITVPMVLSVLLTAVMFPIAGLTDLTVKQVVAASAAGAPLAPMYALFIAGFAANKVQGFALAKAAGVLFVPSIVSWFIAMPSQIAFGLVPQFWPLKVFWAAHAGEPVWGWVAGGLAYHAVVLALLMRRFDAVTRR